MRVIDAHTAQISDQIACPAVDILFLHQLAHALHSYSSFFRCHLQRVADSICRPFNVVRVKKTTLDDSTAAPVNPPNQRHPWSAWTSTPNPIATRFNP